MPLNRDGHMKTHRHRQSAVGRQEQNLEGGIDRARLASHHNKLGERHGICFPSETSEGASAGDSDFRLPVSRTVREESSAALSHAVVVICFCHSRKRIQYYRGYTKPCVPHKTTNTYTLRKEKTFVLISVQSLTWCLKVHHQHSH